MNLGVSPKYENSNTEVDDRVNGKKVVVTGSFSFISRDDIKKVVENRGGTTSDNNNTFKILISNSKQFIINTYTNY